MDEINKLLEFVQRQTQPKHRDYQLLVNVLVYTKDYIYPRKTIPKIIPTGRGFTLSYEYR